MMKSYDINNPRVVKLLDKLVYLYRDKYDVPNTNRLIGSFDDDHNDWLSNNYRDSIIQMGHGHDGSPARARSYALKPDHYLGDDRDTYFEDFHAFNQDMLTELGINTNALSQLYPPQGFIAWHSNADAPGYNLIFTWSENGDGWFKYVDHNGQTITIQDKPGWTLKAGYFGTNDEQPVYHAAYTNCWRMTHSFVVARSDKQYWLDCLDYIQSE